MATRDSIVCALDGGQATVHLARVAADLARVVAAPLTLVHVLGAMPDADWDAAGAVWCRQTTGRPSVSGSVPSATRLACWTQWQRRSASRRPGGTSFPSATRDAG